MPSAQPLARLAPPLFVVIWATGFVVARIVAPYAEPLTFLLVRYLLAIAVLAGLVVAAGLSWPRTGREWGSALVAGILQAQGPRRDGRGPSERAGPGRIAAFPSSAERGGSGALAPGLFWGTIRHRAD